MNTSKTVQQNFECNIGIDISKRDVHICSMPDDSYERVPNGMKEIEAYFNSCFKDKKVGCIVLEATGEYEKKAADILANMGYYVSIINPKRSHNWKDILGVNPKTDKYDAHALAMIAQQFSRQERFLRRYYPPTENQLKLRQFVDRLKQLTDDSVSYQNRITHAQDVDNNNPTIESMKEALELIEKQKKEFLNKIRELIASDPT